MIDNIKILIGVITEKLLFKVIVPNGSLTIFMFHRIVPEKSIDSLQYNLCITPEKFENILLALKKKFNLVHIHEWIGEVKKGRACAITFDDGWIDNYEYGLPILKKHSIPATVFICTGMIGTKKNFWFNRLSQVFHQTEEDKLITFFNDNLNCSFPKDLNKKYLFSAVCNKLKKNSMGTIELIIKNVEYYCNIDSDKSRVVLNWDEIKEMSRNNISFGSHCVNHAILTELSFESARYEMISSYQDLSSQSIFFSPVFSFPNGSYSEELLAECKSIGYIATLTASIDQWKNEKEYLNFPRIAISQKSNVNNVFYLVVKSMLKRLL